MLSVKAKGKEASGKTLKEVVGWSEGSDQCDGISLWELYLVKFFVHCKLMRGGLGVEECGSRVWVLFWCSISLRQGVFSRVLRRWCWVSSEWCCHVVRGVGCSGGVFCCRIILGDDNITRWMMLLWCGNFLTCLLTTRRLRSKLNDQFTVAHSTR